MKRVWKITFFSLNLDRDLDNQAAHSRQKFPGIPSQRNREYMFNLAWVVGVVFGEFFVSVT